MIRRPPRSTQSRSSAASDVYKRQLEDLAPCIHGDLLTEIASSHRRGNLSDVADLAREVRSHEVHVLGEVLPGSRHSADLSLAPELSLRADLAGHTRDLVGERTELIDHRVDRLLELEHLALDVDRDLLAEVTVRHGGRHLSDVPNLVGEVRGHEVDGVGEVLPRSRNALDLGLAPELSIGADFSGDSGHLIRKGAQRVGHRVDGVGERRDLSPRLDRDLLTQVSLSYRRRDLADASYLTGQVSGHEVHRVGEVLPGSRNALDLGLAAELAVRSHLARHARDLVGKARELIDHRVDGLRERGDLSLRLDRDLLTEIALGDRRCDGRDASHLTGQVRGHEVDAVGEVLPRSGHTFDLSLTPELPFGAALARASRYLIGESAQLVGHRVDGVCERGDLSLRLDRDLLREVSIGHRRGHVGDVSHLARQVAGHEVHRVGQVLPRSRYALDFGLTPEDALGADLSSDSGYLVRKRTELIHHRVDRCSDAKELALYRLTLDLQRHLLAEITLGQKMALEIEGQPVKGEFLRIGTSVNSMVDQLSACAAEVPRVAREVGTEGIPGGQAKVKGVSGTWKDLTDSVNFMASNLTSQVRNISDVATAVADGDLSQKITVEAKGEVAALADTINTMTDQLSAFADEVTRVAREVGTEGKLGGQAQVKGVSGTWKDLTDSVNFMASNLTSQVRSIASVATAVAQGDLSQQITVEAKGEVAALAKTINTMVDQLSRFADEVTRVAREVGTEGKLGGHACDIAHLGGQVAGHH